MGSSLYISVLFLCLFQDVILGEEADALSYIPKWENLECEVVSMAWHYKIKLKIIFYVKVM